LAKSFLFSSFFSFVAFPSEWRHAGPSLASRPRAESHPSFAGEKKEEKTKKTGEE
jgi:hypothetical protein